jgi:predicted ATPase
MPDGITSELAFILFVDIAGYSLLPTSKQATLASQLKKIARKACALSAPHARRSKIACDAGDGLAIIFFELSEPILDTAAKLASALRAEDIPTRIGIHAGEVVRLADVNGNASAAGTGINLAQRVMSCGDPGHVLISRVAADLTETEAWKSALFDLGPVRVKHGLELTLLNFACQEFGDAATPSSYAQQAHVRKAPAIRGLPTLDRIFIGRTRELEVLKDHLASGRRLITITGAGGMGKTTLATHAAAEFAASYSGGGAFISCDGIQNEEELAFGISKALDLDESAPTLVDLAETLRSSDLLLLFDCFEHLANLAPKVDHLHRSCPNVTLLITSRLLLGLPSETEMSLGPLLLEHSPKALADAERLFFETAAQGGAEVVPSAKTVAIVRQIVAQAEGVPLAIVLAAGRLRYLSLAELAEQIAARRLDVLRRKGRDSDKHANLIRVIDDSFNLLDRGLKELLTALSVFRGGFFIEDAITVLSDKADVEFGIEELRDNSLLSCVTLGERMRYKALDMVLDYVERVATDQDLARYREAHARAFVAKALKMRSVYDSGQWKECASELWSDLSNYRSAVQFCVGSLDQELLRPLAAALSRIFMEAGLRAEFELLANAGLQAAENPRDIHLLIELTGLLGGMHRRDGNWKDAQRLWVQRTALCAQFGDAALEADTWLDLADTALLLASPREAESYLSQFARLEPLLPRGHVLANGKLARARVKVNMGERSSAREYAQQAETVLEELPEHPQSFYAWNVLAEIYNSLGEAQLAQAICARGISASIAARHYSYAGAMLLQLSNCYQLLGDDRSEGQCLAVAGMIPKTVSKKLREDLIRRRESFCSRFGTISISLIESEVSGIEWQQAALQIAKSVRVSAVEVMK